MWDTTPRISLAPEPKQNRDGVWHVIDVKEHETNLDSWVQFKAAGVKGRKHLFILKIKVGDSWKGTWDYMRVLVMKNPEVLHTEWSAWIHFDHLHEDGDVWWHELGGLPFGSRGHNRLLDENGDEIHIDLGCNRLVDMKHLVGMTHGAEFTPKPKPVVFRGC